MVAFADHSLLCRLALKQTGIDPATFTLIRILSAAFVLWLIARLRVGPHSQGASWLSSLALFVYAAGYSFVYVSLPAATGALLLFGAVQATMISIGIWSGARLQIRQVAGLIFAFGALVGLLLPELSALPLLGSLLMLAAGFARGVYSLRSKGSGDPTSDTAGNFMRALVFSAGLGMAMVSSASFYNSGV